MVLFKFFERHYRDDQSDGTFACLAVVMRRRCRIGAVNADTIASVDMRESREDGSSFDPGNSKKYNGCACSDTSGGDYEMYIDAPKAHRWTRQRSSHFQAPSERFLS